MWYPCVWYEYIDRRSALQGRRFYRREFSDKPAENSSKNKGFREIALFKAFQRLRQKNSFRAILPPETVPLQQDSIQSTDQISSLHLVAKPQLLY